MLKKTQHTFIIKRRPKEDEHTEKGGKKPRSRLLLEETNIITTGVFMWRAETSDTPAHSK